MTQTFYMVEMDYPDRTEADRADYDAFYDRHISMLLSIDGFLSAQRFRTEHAARAPYLAIYRVRDKGVLTSEAYTSKAGRMSVAPEFRARMTNWDRNLVETDAPENAPGAGCLTAPVAPGVQLVTIDRLTTDAPPLPDGFRPLEVVGLDRTVAQRGARTGAGEDIADRDGWIVRRFRTLGPVRTPA